jgi:hypothetical protein
MHPVDVDPGHRPQHVQSEGGRRMSTHTRCPWRAGCISEEDLPGRRPSTDALRGLRRDGCGRRDSGPQPPRACISTFGSSRVAALRSSE